MPDIGTAVGLLVAATELKTIRDIRAGIRANLIAAGGVPGPLGTITMPKPVGSHQSVNPEPRIEPRRIIHPTPIYAPRMVVQPEPTVEAAPIVPAVDASSKVRHDHPMVPPWRMPQPVGDSMQIVIVKCPPPPPDVMNKGSLIDFFM